MPVSWGSSLLRCNATFTPNIYSDTHYNIQYICSGLCNKVVYSNCPLLLLFSPAAKTCCFHKSVCWPLVTSALKRVLQAGSRLFLSRCRQFWTMAALPWGFPLHWDARDHCVTSPSYIFAACSNIHIMSWCLCSVVVGCLSVSVSYEAVSFHCSPTDLLVVHVLVSVAF